MSIYDDVIVAQQLIDECYDPITGEILEEQEELAIKLKAEILGQGANSLCKVRVNMQSEIDSLKNEEKRLADKRKIIEKKLLRLEGYIYEILKTSGEEKIKTELFTVGTRKSESVVLAENFENKDFGTYEFKADKKAIKEAIKKGEQIAGAEIVVNYNLSIK